MPNVSLDLFVARQPIFNLGGDVEGYELLYRRGAQSVAADGASTRQMSVDVIIQSLLEIGLDGIVIATPSALHAEQSIRALQAGVAVFCQKPLGRTAAEVRQVPLSEDMVDRFIASFKEMRDVAMRKFYERQQSRRPGPATNNPFAAISSTRSSTATKLVCELNSW